MGWQYLPVPDDPDKHVEYDARTGVSLEGLDIIGARVRGKKHKHEGTNGDDWFEFATAGPWTIIAVSDGAGSAKFSRVGARCACEAAVKDLSQTLNDIRIKDKEDVDLVSMALHQAMRRAYAAIQTAAAARADSPDHKKLLQRQLALKDLSATLLLALHTTVKFDGGEYSAVFGCQIGDGITGVLDSKGRVYLLGAPDSGEYSGETDFLTNGQKLSDEHLYQKTFVFSGQIKALMVMTDGVADDYFPNDPGLARLYGDLALNHILDLKQPTNDEMNAALQKIAPPVPAENPPDVASISAEMPPTNTVPPSLDLTQMVKSGIFAEAEALTAKGPQKVRVRSVAAYAEKLGVSLEKILADPVLLLAGAQGEPMCEEKAPKDRLRIWLDSYYVRGSFDDRTLVILYSKG